MVTKKAYWIMLFTLLCIIEKVDSQNIEPINIQINKTKTFVVDSIPNNSSDSSTSKIDTIKNNHITANIRDIDSNHHISTKDTILKIDFNDLDNYFDLKSSFNETNSAYTKPFKLNNKLAQILKKDKENQIFELSPEALFWVNWKRDPSTYFSDDLTFRDTCIFNPIFLPLVFKGGMIDPENTILYEDTFKKINNQSVIYKMDTTLFAKESSLIRSRKAMYDYIRINHPDLFSYTKDELPTEVIKAKTIKKVTYEPNLSLKIENEPNIKDVDAPVKFLPERRYWTSNFESSMQFAQAYFSKNWYNAGQKTNINLNTRNYFRYNYNKNKVRLTNELEIKISANNAPKDTLRNVSITENNLRLHTNFGYLAFAKKWFYSVDCNINTKLFNTYNPNDEVTRITGFLAPMTIVLGVGMKYDLNKKLKGNKYRKATFNVNISPLALTHRYSRFKEHFDFGRHGFDKNKKDSEGRVINHQTYVGSDVTTNLNIQFNKTTRWTSRFNYNTSYHRIIGTFENRVEFAVGRFFSTQINLNLRYDDFGKGNEDLHDIPLQINESLTFGFSYRW